jgi:periplasmic divalent cation tolerance protein
MHTALQRSLLSISRALLVTSSLARRSSTASMIGVWTTTVSTPPHTSPYTISLACSACACSGLLCRPARLRPPRQDGAEAAEKIASAITGSSLVPDAGSIQHVSIRAFYWWEGAVQNDTEIRLQFETESTFEDALAAVAKDHNYDVPMIVSETMDESSGCWKGVLTGSAALAAELAGTRLVACAQIDESCDAAGNPPEGNLVVKTVAAAKGRIEERVGRQAGTASTVRWVPVRGNQAYLDWVKEETKA